MPELIAAILHGREQPLESIRADIPEGLREVVHRCLDKDPAKRFANIAHLATALAPFGPPSRQASVDRITHLLGKQGTAVAPPAEMPTDATAKKPPPDAGATAIARTPVESLPGASQSVTLPSSPSPDMVGGAARAGFGARRGRVVGSIAAVAAAAAIGFVAVSRTAATGGEAPLASGAGMAPGRSAVAASIERDVPAPAEEPTMLVPALEEKPTSSAAAITPASAPPATPRVVQPKGASAARSAAPPPAAVPTPAATSNAAASPSARVDPLARLKSL
jgi:serine/threonine-protein kinase